MASTFQILNIVMHKTHYNKRLAIRILEKWQYFVLLWKHYCEKINSYLLKCYFKKKKIVEVGEWSTPQLPRITWMQTPVIEERSRKLLRLE